MANRVSEYVEYLKDSWLQIALGGILAVSIFNALVTTDFQNREPDRAEQQREEIKRLLQDQSLKDGVTLERIEKISSQNTELLKLVVCLNQYIRGGNQTDDPECQRRIEAGPIGALMVGNVPQPVPNHAPQSNSGNNNTGGGSNNPPPVIQPPGLEICTIIVCAKVK